MTFDPVKDEFNREKKNTILCLLSSAIGVKQSMLRDFRKYFKRCY